MVWNYRRPAAELRLCRYLLITDNEGASAPFFKRRFEMSRILRLGEIYHQNDSDATEDLTTTSAADSLAIPVTHAYVAKTTGADAEALTLANGTPGQLLVINLTTDGGGDGTLTPTTKTGFTTIVFADAGDQAVLLYIDDTIGWILLAYKGLTSPPVTT